MRDPILLQFSGELDASSAATWRQQLAQAAGHDLTLDLRAVTFVDSTFLNTLFRLAREGRHITVVECPPTIVRVMAVAGLAGVAEVIPGADGDELGHGITST